MKQHYFDEKTGIGYTLQGDYYLPNLTLPDEKTISLSAYGDSGICGISVSINEYFTPICWTSGKLNGYLADIDEQAEDMFFRLVKQMSVREGVTDQLKQKTKWSGLHE